MPAKKPVHTLPDFAAIHEQLRSHKHLTLQLLWEGLGARGGKIFCRNQRAHRALMPPSPPATPRAEAPETTGAAIATLDATVSVAAKCGKASPETQSVISKKFLIFMPVNR